MASAVVRATVRLNLFSIGAGIPHVPPKLVTCMKGPAVRPFETRWDGFRIGAR